ncbi:hypothetical protein [Glutamicibacter creatinolyticus]|uniref:hypothetical protein n=1 Tax=Glutamicibacter creatinolyticus TaxID=162496 RepID=UPI0037C074F5
MPARAANQGRFRGSLPGALWRALVTALVAGLLGSTIHASLFYAGDVPVFWGLALAWLLLGLLVYWASVASGKLLGGALGFIGCYVVVGVLTFNGNDRLITPLSLYDYMPGPALASTLWVYGMLVPAVVALLLARRNLRRPARAAIGARP